MITRICMRLALPLVFLLIASAASAQPGDQTETAAFTALARAVDHLKAVQRPDGAFNGPLESDTSITGNFILLTHYVGMVDPDEQAGMVAYIRSMEVDGGGWSQYPGGAATLNVTVVTYAALRAAGVPATDDVLVRARAVIEQLGGIGRIGLHARTALVFLGLIPRKAIPHASTKLVRPPSWIKPDIHDLPLFRTVAVPIAILFRYDGIRPLPPEHRIDELITPDTRWRRPPHEDPELIVRPAELTTPDGGTSRHPGKTGRRSEKVRTRLKSGTTWAIMRSVSVFSRFFDRVFPRRRADQRAVDWVLERIEADGSYAGAFAPSMFAMMALDAVPEGAQRATVEQGMQCLRSWMVADERGLWQQFAPSTTWDTANGLRALMSVGATTADLPGGERYS